MVTQAKDTTDDLTWWDLGRGCDPKGVDVLEAICPRCDEPYPVGSFREHVVRFCANSSTNEEEAA